MRAHPSALTWHAFAAGDLPAGKRLAVFYHTLWCGRCARERRQIFAERRAWVAPEFVLPLPQEGVAGSASQFRGALPFLANRSVFLFMNTALIGGGTDGEVSARKETVFSDAADEARPVGIVPLPCEGRAGERGAPEAEGAVGARGSSEAVEVRIDAAAERGLRNLLPVPEGRGRMGWRNEAS